MSELNIPESWAETEFENAIHIEGGSQPPKSDFINEPRKGYIRLIQIRDFRSDDHPVYIPLEKCKRLFTKDDIMIGRYGPPVFQILRGKEGSYNVALMKATPTQLLDKEYMYWFLRNPKIYDDVNSVAQRSAGQTGVNLTFLNKYPVPVPPLKEQLRVVSKIVSCFEKIDVTEASLDKVETLLKKFREALLAKAFRGELAPQDPKDDSAGVLLEKIRKDRLQNAKIKKADQEFAPIADDEKPFDLPTGWEWVTFGEIIEYARYGTSEKCSETRGKQDIPILRMGNIQNGTLDVSDLKYLSLKKLDESLILEKGDILFNRTNSLEHVGKSAVFKLDGEWSYAGYLISVKLHKDIDPNFLVLFINSKFGRAYIEKVATNTGRAQSNVNAEKMKLMPIPLPPKNIQRKISQLIQQSDDRLRHQYEILNKQKQFLSLMKKSILQQAFEGRLVDQISSEGTGHELLAQILAEKNSIQKTEPKEKTKKTIKKAPAKKAETVKGKKNGKK